MGKIGQCKECLFWTFLNPKTGLMADVTDTHPGQRM